MNSSWKRIGRVCLAGFAATAVAAVAGTLAPVPAPVSPLEPAMTGAKPGFRRLSQIEFVRSVEQIFGPGITVPGRFDPPLRDHGMMAIGAGTVTITPSGIEQVELRAREIAGQVLSPARRASVLDCTPAATFDEPCASRFFSKYGRLLYRRPLTSAELGSTIGLARSATELTHDFGKGLEIGLSRLLASPKFIFRVETSEPDPLRAGQFRLDDWSLAARISFLLWDAPPDADLLDAVVRGDLRNESRLTAQVDRMIADPRFEQGVRAFFIDMFGFEQFDGLSKDQSIYPKFNGALAKDAQEQMLRTVVDLLVTRKGDYRDLFTTRQTFMNRNLAALYKVPVSADGVAGWTPYTFDTAANRAGILTFAGMLMLDPTHEGRSSPTIRGKTVRELLLCQPVPAPPPNVNITAVQNTADQVHRTARDRLTVHQENPACAGCHALTDPIGLSMENYDAVGSYRTQENGAVIDAGGKFDGMHYANVLELQKLMHDGNAAPACVVQRSFEYGTGRALAKSDKAWHQYALGRFAAEQYRLPALMRLVATSQAFRAVKPDQPLAPAKAVALR